MIREEIRPVMKNIALTCFLLLNLVLKGQDSVAFLRDLNAVDVIVKVRAAQNGTRIDVSDSSIARLYPAGTLTDLLGTGGSVALKSVGPGALSTVSIRGANSMQTPVLWNGINLQNINNNTVDLSLLPVFLFDNVAVEPGSTSAAWGSGSIGGIIRVNSGFYPVVANKTLYDQFVHFRTVNEFGSFGTFMNGAQFGFGKNRTTVDIRAYRQSAQNDFTFHNTAVISSPLDTLVHANMYQQGVMSSFNCYSKNRHHRLGLRSWVQETNREIPPTMLQTDYEAVQRDYAWRTLLDYDYWTGRMRVGGRAAVIHEGLLWDAGFNSPLSNTNAWSVISEVNAMKYWNDANNKILDRSNIHAGLTFNWGQSEVSEFIRHHEQVRVGAFASYHRFFRAGDEFEIILREEVIDGRAIEPVGSIWYSLNLRDKVSVKGCVSHNYRIPTFNDLYWAPGGNPDLKAETGWTEELTVSTELTKYSWKVRYSVTTYNRNVVNMITWVPHASYWSPINVAEVWSRGMEHRLRIEYKPFWWSRIILLANADYVRSTYEKTDDPNDVAIGKQLIYVPAWFGGSAVTLEVREFYATYSYQYTDLRFTTRDHLEYLPGYGVSSAAVGYRLLRRTATSTLSEVNLFIRCNNITNVEYQSVAWRPMPGRAFTAGLSIDFGRQIQPKQKSNLKVHKSRD